MGRTRANIAALRTLRQLQAEQRPAAAAEQAVLARWGGWGAIPQVFDQRRDDFAWARDELRDLLSPIEWAAAERNTLNAHYTDPAYVREIWSAVRDLGFERGRVLEPGCGTGNFIGLAPPGAEMIGVELDPITAGITEKLYPHAQVLTESFAETRVADASFDLAIGNVPFGDVALLDRKHNAAGHSIHNHFIVKSLHLVKPGGTVAVLTSRYTMDAQNPAARREIAQLADLVGAVRLPAGAHQQAAGTAAVTDVLILRRRDGDRDAGDPSWVRTRTVRIGEHDVPVNSHFLDRPDHVLGELHTRHGQYRADELTVEATGPVVPALRTALAEITAQAQDLRHQPHQPAGHDVVAEPLVLVAASQQQPEGYLSARDDGSFTVVAGGREQPHPVPATQAPELRALLGLRDTSVALLNAEAAAIDDTPELADLRAELNRRYDAYAARFGPINRFSWARTGRVDPATGEEKMRRVPPKQAGFRLDPYSPAVYALERFDPQSQTAEKESIFARRVIAPRAPRLGADSPADALAICLDTHGRVQLDTIAELLGTDPAAARADLGTLVYEVPPHPESAGTSHNAPGEAEPGQLVPAAEYLSGNVRRKHAAAVAAAALDERFAVNAAALAQVIPEDIPAEDIAVQLGAVWIGEPDVRDFLIEVLGDKSVQVQHTGGTNWQVRGSGYGVAATQTWGTERAPAPMLAQALLQQRPVAVFDKVDLPGGKEGRVLNIDATVLAQEKATALNERFAEWVWEDPKRTSRLVQTYNETFNAVVTRTYDDAELSLPGLALTFQPRPHQVAAVARMIHEPAVGLYHEVGAGKTAEMAMGCMELRRLSLIRKPCVVVPNHMLEQFGREWAQLYPRARLLVASSADLAGRKRREFVGRCATGDWDAVILTSGAFERISMSVEAQAEYLNREVESMRAQIERAKGRENPLGVKRMQAALLRAEERVKDKLDGPRDPGITFENTGIDYVVVDEAHRYKNLRTPSNIPGAAIDGSQRASDLDMKLNYLRGRHGARVGTFATATPIANSVTEAYVMQRYLRPDLLEDAGIDDFDSWAATFGQSVTAVELSPDSSSFRMQTRFAKFRNVPELLRMWHVSADIKTAEDLNLATPDLVPRPDGRREPEIVTIPASPALMDYIAVIGQRAEKVRNRMVDPDVDNMLKITSDGRAAALDLRLVDDNDPDLFSGTTKIAVAAARIAAIHDKHAATTYPGSDRPGALQLVFCDLGTPKDDDRWTVYAELKELIAEHGVPAEKVRFIHEARNDQQKGELFAACRSGQVAVLIGSTERMGVGTNVQARAAALHHLDCPWRPADLAQRDGRVIRQGNLNPEVEILRYVTEGSFDGYSWQTVARKATFIAQVMRGRLDTREIEDIGDNALSYNEVKALATGNPLLLDHANAQAELTRLERLYRAHDRAQRRLPTIIDDARRDEQHLTTRLQHIETALDQRQPTAGDRFAMTLDGRRYTERVEAQEALVALLRRFRTESRLLDTGQQAVRQHVATVGGVSVTAIATKGLADPAPGVTVQVHGVDNAEVFLNGKDWEPGGHGVITRLENAINGLDQARRRTHEGIERARGEIERSSEQLNKPFARADELAVAEQKLSELEALMAEHATPEKNNATPPTPDAAASAPSRSARLGLAGSVVPIRNALQHPPEPSESAAAWRRDESAELQR